MEYEIHIQDVDNLEDILIEHYAEKDSLSVAWLGGDDPTQPIVPSVCRFTLETSDGEDGKYLQYFTSKEKKWRVTKVISSTQEIVGRWFLLPETFREPYLNPLFYTSFEATDGLGLLKGETLPDDFYKKEKSVIEILSECLKLTQIDFDIYLAPAIQNKVKENWKDIILDCSKYYDEDKPPSAYVFLEELVFSMRCQLFQCEGRWYIEGINRRHIPKVKFYKYTIEGEYLGTVDITKNIKETSHFLGADVSMLPALGKVTVTHESPELKITEQIYQEDVEWIVPPGVSGKFLPRHWLYPEHYQPHIFPPDHFLELPGNTSSTTLGGYHTESKIELRDKPFVQAKTRVRVKMQVQLIYKGILGYQGEHPFQTMFDNGDFVDPMIYRVSINDNTIFYNTSTTAFDPARIELDVKGAGEVQLDFIAQENGYFNIELWEPKFMPLPDHYMQIKLLTVENLQQKKNDVITLEVDEYSSWVNDIDLPISDDISALSKNFQLEKIKELDPNEAVIVSVPILYHQNIGGKNYSIVSLEGAVLIEQFPDQVYWYGLNLKIKPPTVYYNLNGGNEMAIETGTAVYGYNSFYVKVQPRKDPITNRLDWLRWTDSVYGIEEKKYSEVVAEIERRMFMVPRLSIQGAIDFPLKFNDLLKFTYKGVERYFSFSDLGWSSDNNESTFIANEAYYEGQSTGNIPPLVYAGSDIKVPDEGTFSVIIYDAAATSPAGNITGLLWDQVSGEGVAKFSDPTALRPYIYNLTGDQYTFRLTGTNDAGLTASDEMNVYRMVVHAVTFSLVSSQKYTKKGVEYSIKQYKVNISPELPTGVSVLFKIKGDIRITGTEGNEFANGYVRVVKNGTVSFGIGDGLGYLENEYSQPGSIQYTAGDEILIDLYNTLGTSSTMEVTQILEITEGIFAEGIYRTMAGIPASVSQIHAR